MFYDPNLPLKIDSDASSVGLGAVLSHILPSGEERPIEFASRTLSKTERNYGQVEKEALALIWSVKKWHRYVYARKFTLMTDHKPLLHILSPHKQVPEMTVSRLQRWSMILACYDYDIKFRPTGKHGNADMCSRFPLKCEQEDPPESLSKHDVYSMYDLDDKILLNSTLIAKLTQVDPVLSKVLYYTKHGWPSDNAGTGPSDNQESNNKLKPYHRKRFEITMEQGCLLWGSRVLIPEKLRTSVLELLHCTHLGISSTKALARSYIWFPGLDVEIEQMVKHCEACQMHQANPASSIPHPWTHPTGPWERIHIDFCAFNKCEWLIIVDAYSKWLEVVKMGQNTTSKKLIEKLREVFSHTGLPIVLVSDNGPS